MGEYFIEETLWDTGVDVRSATDASDRIKFTGRKFFRRG